MTNIMNTSFSWPKELPFIKKVGIAVSVIVALSAPAPFVELDFFNNPMYLSLLDYSIVLGIIALVCGAVGLIFSIFGKYVFCLIPGAVSLGVIAAYPIMLHKMLLSVGPIHISRNFVKPDTGYYLLITGTVGLVIVGAVGVLIRIYLPNSEIKKEDTTCNHF